MGTDVAVVGAGPTGLTLACGLQAAGISVRVLDKAAGPATTSRALGLQPRGVEVLDRVGALGDLPDHGIPIEQIVVTVNGRELARLRVVLPVHRLKGRSAILISQAKIERALRDRFAELGGTVEWGRAVTGLSPDGDGVTVTCDEPIRAGWVVGADGAHSAVRKAAGIYFPGVPIIEGFLLADVHADIDRPRDSTYGWLRGSSLLAAFPLPGDSLWRVMAPAPSDMPENPDADAIVAHLGRRLTDEVDATIHAVEWTSSFSIQRRLADSYRRGRILLAGDAAHIHSPFGGQGMNTGIGDAENLAFKLAMVITGRAAPALLDTYAAERRPVAEGVLNTTSGLTEFAIGEQPTARLVRDRVVVPLLNQPWMQRFIAERGSQLRVTYRNGPWGAGARRWLPGLQPGDRVADRECVREDGTATRLHAELGPSWALLGPATLAEVARERLGDVVTLRGTRHALLVRPDGHLAWRGSDPAALQSWLESALGVR